MASKEAFFDLFWPLEQKMALKICLLKLSRKAMHSEELKRLLEERHFSEQAIIPALSSLERLGALNDRDFTSHLTQKMQKQGKSRRQILIKCSQKGICPEEITPHLESDEAALRQLILKRYPILFNKKATFIQKQKAKNALFRRGFSPEAISCIIKEEVV